MSSITIPSVVSAEEQHATQIACEYIISAAEQLQIQTEIKEVQRCYDTARSNGIQG